jgi:hypothetical protein
MAVQRDDNGADIYAGLMARMEAIGDEFARLAKTDEQKALAKGFTDFVAGEFNTLLAHLTDPARGSATTGPTLRAGLTWLLDDMEAAGEDRDPKTGQEYDSVAFARAALAADKDAARGAAPAASAILPATSRTGAPESGNAYARALDASAAQAQPQNQDKPRSPKR